MFLSLAIILLGGLAMGILCQKIKLPALLGMLVLGILLSEHCLNILDPQVLTISADLRQIALLIILLRAGLDLNLEDLKKVGRPAILMCFLPATLEIIGCAVLGPILLGLTLPESLLLGSVLGAVSPAVVVPGMLKLMEKKQGTKEGIPQLILAGASADGIYCLVLFTCFTGLVSQGSFDAATLLRIPTSILFGIAAGVLVGFIEVWLFRNVPLSTVNKVLIVMGISFLLVWIEKQFTGNIGFSGLLAVIASGMVLAKKDANDSKEISNKMNALWQCAQIFLFVLVGAAVDIRAIEKAGLLYILMIAGIMVFRMFGVWLATSGSIITKKEQLFCMLAYTPKATVQAAIGAVPLSMGLACGNTVLTMAVLAILITAPFGALAIEKTSPKLLVKEQ